MIFQISYNKPALRFYYQKSKFSVLGHNFEENKKKREEKIYFDPARMNSIMPLTETLTRETLNNQ